MISILGKYVMRQFLARFFVILLALVALTVLADLLANSDEITEASQDIAMSLARYSALRLPAILSQVIPMSVLLAALTLLAGLAQHSELTAMFGAGVSHFRVVLMFLPAALLVAVFQFTIEDQLVPPTSAWLRAWGVGDYKKTLARDPRGMMWFRQDGDLVRVGRVSTTGKEMSDVTIFRRDAAGRFMERVEARQANYHDGSWTLREVVLTNPETGDVDHLTRLDWPNAIESTVLYALSLHPRELPWTEVWRLAAKSGYGNQPVYLYDVWLQKKVARPLATVVLVLLAMASVQRMHPRRSARLMLVAGVGIGFVYWVFDELVVTMGEAGLLPALLAAWAAPAVLGAVAMAVILRYDGH